MPNDKMLIIDRAWWREQGIEACIDRIELIATQHYETLEREITWHKQADRLLIAVREAEAEVLSRTDRLGGLIAEVSMQAPPALDAAIFAAAKASKSIPAVSIEDEFEAWWKKWTAQWTDDFTEDQKTFAGQGWFARANKV